MINPVRRASEKISSGEKAAKSVKADRLLEPFNQISKICTKIN